MANFHSTISRRDFMKVLGLTGAGAGAAALTAPIFHDLDEVISNDNGVQKKPWYVKERELENSTTEVDWNTMQRYDVSKTANQSPAAYIPGYADIQTQGFR